MDFIKSLDSQILVGGAVAVFAVVAGAVYLLYSKKPKGYIFTSLVLFDLLFGEFIDV